MSLVEDRNVRASHIGHISLLEIAERILKVCVSISALSAAKSLSPRCAIVCTPGGNIDAQSYSGFL